MSDDNTCPHPGPDPVSWKTVVRSGAVNAGPLTGQVLKGAYLIEGKLGEGGMGVVYRATQITLGRLVAVKTIQPASEVSEQAVERFRREAQVLGQLAHPNIVQIIDFDATGPSGLYFMVMELLQGETLEQYVIGRAPPSLETVRSLMEQICAAVAAAHQGKVIHRDLKPANIFLRNVTGRAQPLVKVLDFGLAKMLAGDRPATGLTQSGTLMGTAGYSAPEQLRGFDSDGRADVYGLGAILYFLVAGRPPYQAETFQDTVLQQLTQPPAPLDAPNLPAPIAQGLNQIVRRALTPNPEDRYSTPLDLLRDLEGLCQLGETVADRPASSLVTSPGPAAGGTGGLTLAPPVAPTRLAALPTRRSFLLAGAVGAGATLAGVTGYVTFRQRGPRPLPASAPGVTATAVRVGLSAPFSGPTRELGRGIKVGIEAVFQSVNDQGGVLGRKLELVSLDDGYEPQRAATNMCQLIDEYQVFAFLGNVGTPTSEVALPVALEAKRVFFAPYTGASLLRKDPPERYVFNYRAGYVEETAALVNYLMRVRKIRPEAIAVLAQNDAFGEAGYQGVARALRKAGVESEQTLKLTYDRNRTNIDEAAAQVLASPDRARAVILAATYKPAAQFIRRVKEGGAAAVFANLSFVGSEALAEELEAVKSHEGVIVTQVVPLFTSGASGVRRYREMLDRHARDEKPGFVSLEGYIAATLFVKGLEAAGENLTSDSLVEGLESLRDLDLGIGTKINFGPSDHQGSHKVWGTVLDNRAQFRDLELE